MVTESWSIDLVISFIVDNGAVKITDSGRLKFTNFGEIKSIRFGENNIDIII